MRKLLTILVLISVVFFTGCKKDNQVVTVGLCPLVVSTIPLDKAVNVPLNQVVSATFNEAMNPATITGSSFTLTGTTTLGATVKAATVVTGTVTYSGMTATFTPSSPLIAHTTYTGTITTAARDLAGNSLQANYVWSFSTDVAPTVTGNPANNAVDVPLNQIVVATFSVPMDTMTLKAPATTITIKQGATVVPGKYSFTNTTVSFTPTVALSPFTVYTLTITTGAKNKLGTALASDYILNFTTIPQVTVSSLPVVGGTTTGGGTLAQGSAATVTAVANAGYSFANWTEGTTVVSALASYPFTVAGNRTLVANFTLSYTLNVTAVNGTVVKVPNSATYNSGVAVVLTATPNAGYVFTSWSGDATGSVNPLTVNMNANKNITANFTAVASTYTLIVTAVNGTVVKLPNSATYNSGDAVVLTATPNVGYVFSSWSGDATGSVNPLTVNMNANKNITANFTLVPPGNFTLNVNAVNGTVLKNPDQPNYLNGANVVLTATPNSGYVFSSWSGDATGSVSPVNVLMNANKNVTANFTLAPIVACPVVIDLGLAGNYVILSESGISTTGTTHVTGNMGVSPITSTAITGDWALNLPAAGAFSTSPRVTGNIYAADYAVPTPTLLTTAINNMSTAFTTANGLTIPAPVNEYMAGNLNGQTLTKGIYKWSSNVLVTNGIILDGGGDNCATFIFQIAGDLTVGNSAIITLQNGAQAKNIFWVVAGAKAALGTGVNFSGNILCKTLISLNTGTVVNGKLLSQTAVTLDASTVTDPQ